MSCFFPSHAATKTIVHFDRCFVWSLREYSAVIVHECFLPQECLPQVSDLSKPASLEPPLFSLASASAATSAAVSIVSCIRLESNDSILMEMPQFKISQSSNLINASPATSSRPVSNSCIASASSFIVLIHRTDHVSLLDPPPSPDPLSSRHSLMASQHPRPHNNHHRTSPPLPYHHHLQADRADNQLTSSRTIKFLALRLHRRRSRHAGEGGGQGRSCFGVV